MTSLLPDGAQPLRVLLIEDSPHDAELLLRELRGGGFAPAGYRVDTEAQLASALSREQWDLVISDHAMPSFSSTHALGMLRRSDDDTPFIIVSGHIDEAEAVAAMRAGAQDYVWKDNLARLAPAVRRELREADLRRERRRTQQTLQRSAVQYRQMMELCPEAILIVSDARIAFANQAAVRLWAGTAPEQLIGRELSSLAAPDSRRLIADMAASLSENSGRRTAVAQWLRLDGGAVEAEASACAFVMNEAAGLQLVLRPTPAAASPRPADRAADDAAAKARQGRSYRPSAYAAVIGVLVFGALFGLAELEEALAPLIDRSFAHFANAGLAAALSALIGYAVLRRGHRMFELVASENAQRRRAELELQDLNRHLEQRVHERTHDFELSNEQLKSELQERRRAEARLDQMARYDGLTGIPNRTLFFDRLASEIAASSRAADNLAVCFMDLDRFKSINDTLGHDVGDRLLQRVASTLRATVREADTVARLGGDEFALILTALAHKEDGAAVARKILNALGRPMRVGPHELYAGASIGISLYPEDGDNAELLVKNADTAMYKAKDAGRNGFCFYAPEMNARALERLELETALRQAVEAGEFVLYYQPKYTVRGRSRAGAEALLRWSRPGRGLVSPAEFIPLLEETGLIQPVGAWAIRAACRQIAHWRRERVLPGPVAVNISARQFQHESLLLDLAAALDESGIPPAMLELEITESVLAGRPAEALAALRRIKSLGVGLAIDDFGTGYSSLSRLKEFPIDTIKVDRAFVRTIATDGADRHIVAMVVSLARGLGMQVVAEGVETEAQLAVLDELGCEFVQGYLLAKPMPADALARCGAADAALRTPARLDDGADAAPARRQN